MEFSRLTSTCLLCLLVALQPSIALAFNSGQHNYGMPDMGMPDIGMPSMSMSGPGISGVPEVAQTASFNLAGSPGDERLSMSSDAGPRPYCSDAAEVIDMPMPDSHEDCAQPCDCCPGSCSGSGFGLVSRWLSDFKPSFYQVPLVAFNAVRQMPSAVYRPPISR